MDYTDDGYLLDYDLLLTLHPTLQASIVSSSGLDQTVSTFFAQADSTSSSENQSQIDQDTKQVCMLLEISVNNNTVSSTDSEVVLAEQHMSSSELLDKTRKISKNVKIFSITTNTRRSHPQKTFKSASLSYTGLTSSYNKDSKEVKAIFKIERKKCKTYNRKKLQIKEEQDSHCDMLPNFFHSLQDHDINTVNRIFFFDPLKI